MKVDVIPISDKLSILGLLSQGGLFTGTGSHLRALSKRTNEAVVLYPTVGLTDDPGDTYNLCGGENTGPTRGGFQETAAKCH